MSGRVPSHTGTCGLEDTWVAEAVTGGKGLHHAVDLLGLAWQSKAPQELSGGRTEPWAVEVGEALRGGLGGTPSPHPIAALCFPGVVSLSCK